MTDKVMFDVPKLDKRLPNKAEVLALRYGNEPLAIATGFLSAIASTTTRPPTQTLLY